MFFHGGGRDAEARSDFAILQTLEATKCEDLTASRRELVESGVKALAEFCVKKRLLGIVAEIEIVEPFITVRPDEIVEVLHFNESFVFQIIEAGIPNHGEKERTEGEGTKFRASFPKVDEAFLHYVVRSIGAERKAARILAEAGRIGLEEETKSRLVSPFDSVEELGFVRVHLSV